MEVKNYKDRAALHFHNRKQEIRLYIYYTFTISNGSQFHPIIAVLFRYHYISKRLCPLRLPCRFKGVTNITNRSREEQCDLSEPVIFLLLSKPVCPVFLLNWNFQTSRISPSNMCPSYTQSEQSSRLTHPIFSMLLYCILHLQSTIIIGIVSSILKFQVQML